MYLEKVRINFERLVVLLDGLVKAARVVEHPSQVGVYDQRQGSSSWAFLTCAMASSNRPMSAKYQPYQWCAVA